MHACPALPAHSHTHAYTCTHVFLLAPSGGSEAVTLPSALSSPSGHIMLIAQVLQEAESKRAERDSVLGRQRIP